MKIIKYLCKEVAEPGWDFDEVEFGNVNLLVGDTATGKTRFLNTLFNLGRFAVGETIANGHWRVTIEEGQDTYSWEIHCAKLGELRDDAKIVKEHLSKEVGGKWQTLVDRNEDYFKFKDMELPKLTHQQSSISLLREEGEINPIYRGFTSILRRRFFHDALSEINKLHAIPSQMMKDLELKPDIDRLFKAQLNLNATLFLLRRFFRNQYEEIIDNYYRIFPFIAKARIADLSELQPNIAVSTMVPVFSIREKGSDKWVPITELSSGMQKVLLILVDISILPHGGLYIIDEYENSLGINAIDFFPEFVLDFEKEIQFFITSHHPYLINAVPVSNWYVFHRKGMHVSIRYGSDLEQRYGRSSQESFIQLINDPFYTDGVE